MTYTVYVIRNSLKETYVGMSTDVARRLKEHRDGKSASTNKGCLDWQLFFSWECPSYLYMSKLERFLQHMKSETKVLEATKTYPFFSDALKAQLDLIPTTAQETEPDWSKRKHVAKPINAPKRFSAGKGNTVAERKARKKYHAGVKKQRANRSEKMKDVFAAHVLDPETIRKMDQLQGRNSPKYDFI